LPYAVDVLRLFSNEVGREGEKGEGSGEKDKLTVLDTTLWDLF
jgi:hypothetical protein